MDKKTIRDWLEITEPVKPHDYSPQIDDTNRRLGNLAKRVDDNEALLKRIYDHLRRIWTL